MDVENKFYIVIPTFNRPELVLRCLKSVLSQNYKNYVVYIVNDGSMLDYSSVEDFVFKNEKVFYKKMEKNIGLNKVKNYSLDLISKDNNLKENSYFFVLDDDDFLVENALSIINLNLSTNYNWFGFNVLIKSSSVFINVDFLEYKEMSYGEYFLKNMGDKHFVINLNLINNIRFPKKIKNGYEDIFFDKVSKRGLFLSIPEKIVVKEYLEDGLSLSDLYDNYNYFKMIRIRFNYILEDPFSFIYIFQFLKSFLRLKSLMKVLNINKKDLI